MRTCSNCESEIGPDDVFCSNCGTEQALLEAGSSPEHGSGSAAVDGSAAPAATAVETRVEAVAPRAGTYDAPREPSRDGGVMAPAPEQRPKLRRDSDRYLPLSQIMASAPEERPKLPAPIYASTPAGETLEHRYLRQTRNATVFIAVIVGIVTVIALIGIIWTATTISKLDSELSGGNNLFNTSNCQSQGGSNPNC